MITFYRTANVAPGKSREAMAYAKEVSEYITAATGVDVAIAVPLAGNPKRIGWAIRHDSLAGLEEMFGKLSTDPKYADLTADTTGNFIAGSFHDEIWAKV